MRNVSSQLGRRAALAEKQAATRYSLRRCVDMIKQSASASEIKANPDYRAGNASFIPGVGGILSGAMSPNPEKGRFSSALGEGWAGLKGNVSGGISAALLTALAVILGRRAPRALTQGLLSRSIGKHKAVGGALDDLIPGSKKLISEHRRLGSRTPGFTAERLERANSRVARHADATRGVESGQARKELLSGVEPIERAADLQSAAQWGAGAGVIGAGLGGHKGIQDYKTRAGVKASKPKPPSSS